MKHRLFVSLLLLLLILIRYQGILSHSEDETRMGWSIHKLRSTAFENVKPSSPVDQRIARLDPGYQENRVAIQQGKLALDNRDILPSLDATGSYCVITKDKKALCYLPSGETTAFGSIDQNEFPYRLVLYEYPTGKLRSIFLHFSPKDKFEFNQAGELVNGAVDTALWERPSFEKKVVLIGQKLLKDNHVKERIAFRVIQSKENVNAYGEESFNTALISKGLLVYVESDDELAAILGHEIAHIILRHRPRYPKETSDTILQRYFKVSVEPPEDSMEFGKEQEQELDADRFGLRMMMKSGYKPEAMLTVLQKVVSDGSDTLRTHPMGSHRLKAIERQIHFLRQNSSMKDSVVTAVQAQIAPDPVTGEGITLHQWTEEKARAEALKHSDLLAALQEAQAAFPRQDPEHALHRKAMESNQPVSGRSLYYYKAAGPYADLLQGTHAGADRYSVHFERSRVYLSYNASGSLYQISLCNHLAFPRTCYALPETNPRSASILFQVTATDSFLFTEQGDLLGFTRDSQTYDRQGRLMGVTQCYPDPSLKR